MPRLVSFLILICLCLVTTGEMIAYATPGLSTTGVSQARDRVTVSLSVAEVNEESESTDTSIPLATATIAREGDRPQVSNADWRSFDAKLESANVRLYISTRRLLI